jgi:hypothetical protein
MRKASFLVLNLPSWLGKLSDLFPKSQPFLQKKKASFPNSHVFFEVFDEKEGLFGKASFSISALFQGVG